MRTERTARTASRVSGSHRLSRWGSRGISSPGAPRAGYDGAGPTMSASSEPVGTLEVALAHARRLFGSDLAAAAEQATEILRAVPEQPEAALLLGIARRGLGDLAGSQRVLELLTRKQPKFAAAHYELGVTLGEAGQGEAAVAALERALRLDPNLPDAWRALGDHRIAIGDAQGADAAYAQQVKRSTRDPRLLEAANFLYRNKLAPAEALLRAHLKQHPTEVAAIRMLAEVAARLGRYGDAEDPARALPRAGAELHAGAPQLRVRAAPRRKAGRGAGRDQPTARGRTRTTPPIAALKASILVRIGEVAQAADIYARVLSEYPSQPKLWLSYGHALKTAGRQEESVEAYRRTLALAPQLGEAWWSLANLKTIRFSAADLEAMQSQLARDDLQLEDRFHLHFAVGKALEDAQRYAEAFEHYEKGNALRGSRLAYDARETTAQVRRSKHLFTPEFFAERVGQGCPAPDPIFIVGLPRAGSTLVEQILASHPFGGGYAGAARHRRDRARARRQADEASALALSRRAGGARSRRAARARRALPRADPHPAQDAARFFIDKMPNNWAHVGLIHADPAQRQDHRRTPPPARLLLLGLQAALRARAALQLRPRGSRALLPRLRGADGALRRRAAGPRPPRDLRAAGGRLRGRGAPAARLLRAALRRALPALSRERSAGAHRELRAGAAARSTARAPTSGATSSPGWAPSSARSGRCSRRIPRRPMTARSRGFAPVSTSGGPHDSQPIAKAEASRAGGGHGRRGCARPCAGQPAAGADATHNAGDAAHRSAARRARGSGRHRDQAEREPPGRPAQHQGAGHGAISSSSTSQDFDDYAKYLPSLSYTTGGPGFSRVFFRGVASGDNGNHSGPLPSVGQYLDEQPITTIQGALDVHVYDIERDRGARGAPGHALRRELRGRHDPHHHQQAGSRGVLGGLRRRGQRRRRSRRLRRRGVRERSVRRQHRDPARRLEQARRRLHQQRARHAHVRDVGLTIDNAGLAAKDYNPVDTYGARAALRIDLNENWTITPTVMGQLQKSDGAFAYDPSVGHYDVIHFRPESARDGWVQASATVEGHIANFDLVYAGSLPGSPGRDPRRTTRTTRSTTISRRPSTTTPEPSTRRSTSTARITTPARATSSA